MKNRIISLALCFSALVARGQDFPFDQQANLESETHMLRSNEEFRTAREAVLKAIESVKDTKKKEVVRNVFERNERAWGALIESETLLSQRAKEEDETPDIRYLRLVSADRATSRIEQYRAFIKWIGQ